ncbi:MAG: 2-oxoacid:acceptor oxidoreductase subunit alpha [Synergistales bacterium]|nr:2-oxoacid:acceptor oxidoreductase subunit alpha [Synergistales bacterium]
MARFPVGERRDISIVLCGAAGQGVQTVEQLLVKLVKGAGYHVFANREYMSRVRGGNNSTEIRVSSQPVRALVDRIDVLIPMSGGIRDNIRARLDDETVIVGDREALGEEFAELPGTFLHIPLASLAREAGGRVFANVIAAGVMAGLFEAPEEIMERYFRKRFGHKSRETVDRNMQAARMGIERGKELASEGTLAFALQPDPSVEERVVFDGAHAVSLGAVSGGCDFCCGYPMSPATGVLTFMAQNAHTFGVAMEQVEDEIAAINMALGASFAGARPVVTTSGGGVSLMCEGISLSGVAELPVVVHLAQRPGPATGMATRTEQGDLELAVYGGHGEFPRLVYAPGSLEEAVRLTHRALNMADRYQTPVFVLTDQYFINSYYDLDVPECGSWEVERHIVEAGPSYRRYEMAEDGVSPRSVPGYGEGIVGVDSHEHDEEGHVWEDFELRTRMNAKRLKKMEGIRSETVPPTLVGPKDYTRLVLCWGSTLHIVEEALRQLQLPDTALLHLSQVYPLPAETEGYLQQAEHVVAVEGNATGQLCNLLRQETGFLVEDRVLTWKGLQFSVEEVQAGLREHLA